MKILCLLDNVVKPGDRWLWKYLPSNTDELDFVVATGAIDRMVGELGDDPETRELRLGVAGLGRAFSLMLPTSVGGDVGTVDDDRVAARPSERERPVAGHREQRPSPAAAGQEDPPARQRPGKRRTLDQRVGAGKHGVDLGRDRLGGIDGRRPASGPVGPGERLGRGGDEEHDEGEAERRPVGDPPEPRLFGPALVHRSAPLSCLI